MIELPANHWKISESQLRKDPATARDGTAGRRRLMCAGTILKLEGEASAAVFRVASGWLAVSKSLEDGRRQIVEFVLPGESFSPTSGNGLTSAVQVEAVGDVEVAIIPERDWARLREHDPALRQLERQFAAAALARLLERMLRLGKATAEMRIAYALIELCVRLDAIGQADGDRFQLPLTQAQLGDFTGLSSVHVCRTMGRLSHRGIIETGAHMAIAIRDMQRLVDLAAVDLDAIRSAIIPAR